MVLEPMFGVGLHPESGHGQIIPELPLFLRLKAQGFLADFINFFQ